jgi:4-amino-4-deoxy-L-arabinose transferase-like glycosyltransferase
VELAPTPRRTVPFAAPRGVAEVLRLPRLRVVDPAPLLAVLGILVLVNVARLGEGGWKFHAGEFESNGVLGPLVSLAQGRWNTGLLKFSAIMAGLVLVVALAYVRERWTARRAILVTFLVTGLLVVPGVMLQAGLREATAPWFYTNDSTYQVEIAGDLVLAGESPYGHDYRGSGLERFYSRDGTPKPRHKALDHFAYFPGAALTSAGWRVLPAPFDDYRFFVLLATLGLIPAALSFAGPLTVRLAVGAALAGNPLIVQATWFGTTDAPSLFFLVLAFGLTSRSRFAWAAACLAAAVLLKQFALVALPFFAAMLLMSRGGRRSFSRAAGVFAAIVGAGTLPFLIASPTALWADTVGYGTGDYPIVGYGLASLLVHLDVVRGRNAGYPFGLLALLVWLPATLWLVRSQLRSRQPWVGAAGFAASIFLLLFLGRVFQVSYLLWPLAGMGIAAVLAAAQTARGTSTTKVEPRPGSESTEMRPFMRSTSSLLM